MSRPDDPIAPDVAERLLSAGLGSWGFTFSVVREGFLLSRPSERMNFTHRLAVVTFPREGFGHRIQIDHLGEPSLGMELLPCSQDGILNAMESLTQVIQDLNWDYPLPNTEDALP